MNSLIYLMIVLISYVYAFVFKHSEEIDFKVWDYHSLTASNFTVEIKITNEMWRNFKEKLVDENYEGDMSEHQLTHLFELKLIEEINYELEIYVCGTDPDEPSLKVSNISFAMPNKKILNLLKQRGNCINKNHEENLRKIDRKLDEIKENAHYKDMIPVSSFITFETAKGF